MLLLHISDIHFRHPVCGTAMDPDRPYRTHLIRDVRTRVTGLGPVGAILVTGDIAFKAASEEYNAALTWLGDLATNSGCPLERIFVVPGNHDIDRDVIRKNAAVRNAQLAVSSATRERRERELLDQLLDAETGRAILAPLATYNTFAARFNCQVYAPEKLAWSQDLPLDENTTLRIHGLTSTLLSGAGGGDDTRESLYLSPLQTVLDPVDGVVNLVMCHHPPDWFMDHDDVDDALRGRAAIQLFGHKHRQRITRDDSYIRFAAGAVNPERYEPGWDPGYNLVRLTVDQDAGSRYLNIEAQLLVWQTGPDMFHPKMASQDDSLFRHRLRIHRATDLRNALPLRPNVDVPVLTSAAATANSGEHLEAAMSDERTRNLVLRFWSLPSSQRREIALRLKLISEDDMRLPEPERYGRALIRARELGLLTELAEAVTRLERR